MEISPLLGAAGASSLSYDASGPRPPGPPGVVVDSRPYMEHRGSRGHSRGSTGSISFDPKPGSATAVAGAGPTASSPGHLHQKMMKQRQLTLERQRNLSRNRFAGGATAIQANSLSTQNSQASRNVAFGRILGICEDVPSAGVPKPAEGGTGEKTGGGGSSLRSAGAAMMSGVSPALSGGGAGANNGLNAGSGDVGGNDRLRTPAGSNMAGAQKGTPRARSNIEELTLDGLAVMDLGDDLFAGPQEVNLPGTLRQPKMMPSPGAEHEHASDGPGGSASPGMAWGGRMQQDRRSHRGGDTIVETVADFDADDILHELSDRKGAAGGRRSRPPRAEQVQPAPMKKGGWDLDVDVAPEPVAPAQDGNAGGGGRGRRNRQWWNPFGGGGGGEGNSNTETKPQTVVEECQVSVFRGVDD